MEKVIHRAEDRGMAEHGWLHSKHTFSFGGYHNSKRMCFGFLRVLNDDIVEAGMGFGTHSHDNMEIVSIPLSGNLAHKDSMGTSSIISKNEVQIMSAGSGISHSEFNHSKEEKVNFLQIWVLPKEINITPRYGQKKFSNEDRKNKFQVVVSPDKEGNAVWINQDAYFSMADLDKEIELEYEVKNNQENGSYLFVIEGSIEVDGNKINKRDAIGVWDIEKVKIKALENSEILVIEVPLHEIPLS